MTLIAGEAQHEYDLAMTKLASFSSALAGFLLCFIPTSAQVSPRLQSCSPYNSGTNSNEPPAPRIVIDRIDFVPPGIPDELKTQLNQVVRETRQRVRSGWADELAEVVVEGTLQDQGYFKSQSRIETKILSNDAVLQHVSITLHINLGLQYRLQKITFRSPYDDQPLVFPADELRKSIPVADGELFNASKIREGIDSLKKLYGSHGYIDFVAEPATDADDTTHLIYVDMVLDQQKPFRIGRVKVITPEPKLQKLVESEFKPGQIVDTRALAAFFEVSQSELPPGTSLQDVDVARRDVKAGIADLNFNLLTCSDFRSSFDP